VTVGATKALWHIARTTRVNHVELARHAIHRVTVAIGPNVHFHSAQKEAVGSCSVRSNAHQRENAATIKNAPSMPPPMAFTVSSYWWPIMRHKRK
jgi:hypothetical protein